MSIFISQMSTWKPKNVTIPKWSDPLSPHSVLFLLSYFLFGPIPGLWKLGVFCLVVNRSWLRIMAWARTWGWLTPGWFLGLHIGLTDFLGTEFQWLNEELVGYLCSLCCNWRALTGRKSNILVLLIITSLTVFMFLDARNYKTFLKEVSNFIPLKFSHHLAVPPFFLQNPWPQLLQVLHRLPCMFQCSALLSLMRHLLDIYQILFLWQDLAYNSTCKTNNIWWLLFQTFSLRHTFMCTNAQIPLFHISIHSPLCTI